MINLGYCCLSIGINKDLSKKNHIMVNRSMVKKTFDQRGLNYVSELIQLNLTDTLKVLKYNLANGIMVYRMSCDTFPWLTNYEFTSLPQFNKIKSLLETIGNFVQEHNIRVGYHPGPFVVLSSLREDVVLKSADELNKYAEIMDLMRLPLTTFYSINIHLNSAQPTREASAKRFCENFQLLSPSCQKRIVVENDDKLAQFTIQDLHRLVYVNINTPLTIDSLHWQCHNDGYSWEDTFNLAISTWETKPLAHHSSSRKLFEDSTAALQSHADFLHEKFVTTCEIDVELECKMKDLALFNYRKQFNI